MTALATDSAAAPAAAAKVRSRAAGTIGVASYLQAAPLAIILAVFLLIPIATILVVSFWDYDFARIIPDFVLTNYQADPGHLRAIARAVRMLSREGHVQVLVAGFAPGDGRSNPMFDPRVRMLMRSPRPAAEWHGGELETAMMLAAAPSSVRRSVAHRLPPAWVDWSAALARGARTFEAMHPEGRGYFGWPAAARASTGTRGNSSFMFSAIRTAVSALSTQTRTARARPAPAACNMSRRVPSP